VPSVIPVRPLGFRPVELEISPEPTDEERAAIVAALAQEAVNTPLTWEEESSEP